MLSRQSLVSRLAGGITIGPAVITVRRRRDANVDGANDVIRRHVVRLADLFPDVAAIVRPVLAAEPEAVQAVFEFCNDYVPLIHEPARETQTRNLLSRLSAALDNEEARDVLRLAIARSDLRSGVSDRAVALKSLPSDDPARIELERANDEHDAQYGARAGMIRRREHWTSLEGDVRGRSLVVVLERRFDELRGKAILHVAPENTLKEWFLNRRDELRGQYVTLDAFEEGVDLQEDLTALALPNESFDYVICHRVLEHVLDDRAALAEIHRVLRRGGVLNVSVPQSMQLAESNEWAIQDTSHNSHVRQYGRDFEQRLAQAGFEVEVDRTLLERTLEEHLAAETFPMRVYICHKP
jgi:predicted SAM-dependent methyltransferase